MSTRQAESLRRAGNFQISGEPEEVQFCCFRDAAAKLWIGANLKLDQRDSVEIDAPRCAPGKTVNLGRILVFAGLALAAGGLLVMLGAKLGLPRLDRLRGGRSWNPPQAPNDRR